MRQLAEELGTGPVNRRITASPPQGSASPPNSRPNARSRGGHWARTSSGSWTDAATDCHHGDEIHAADRTELAQLAASVQHFIQDRLPIGLVFAGLPLPCPTCSTKAWPPSSAGPTKSISTPPPCGRWRSPSPAPSPKQPSRSPPPSSAARRSHRRIPVPYPTGRILPLEGGGKQPGQPHPRNSRTRHRGGKPPQCTHRHRSALAAASPKDLDFLHAMAEDDGPSVAGDIGRRIGARTNLVANYRSKAAGSRPHRIHRPRKGRLRHSRATPTPSGTSQALTPGGPHLTKVQSGHRYFLRGAAS